jgi:signal transduction histidine kinase
MDIFDLIAVVIEALVIMFYSLVVSSKKNTYMMILSVSFSLLDFFLLHYFSFSYTFIIEFLALWVYTALLTNRRTGLYYASYMMQFISFYHVLFLLFDPIHNVTMFSMENHLIELFMGGLTMMACKTKGILQDTFFSTRDDDKFFVLLILSTLILPLYYTIHPDMNQWQVGDFLFILVIILLIASITMLMNTMMTIMSGNAKMKMIEDSNRYIDLYKKSIEDKNNEIHKIRHDLKKQLSIIKELNKEGKQKASDRLYEKLDDLIDEQKAIDYTGNILCDAYIEAMKQSNKDFHINITSDPITNFVDERKFMIIFTNLIENAYKNTDEAIDVTCSVYQSRVTLKVVNLIRHKKRSSTSEHLGLEIVRETVEDLGGELLIDEQKEGLYIVYVNLPVTHS